MNVLRGLLNYSNGGTSPTPTEVGRRTLIIPEGIHNRNGGKWPLR